MNAALKPLPRFSVNSVLRPPIMTFTDAPAIFMVVLLAVLTLILRGFLPYDETRYIAVAWEMWHNHHWLIPTINGHLYADKPPLLFWLVELGWYLTGVSAWWPRSIPFIFALLNILLTRYIACRLWPVNEGLRRFMPEMLISVPVWFAYTTPFMFDMLQTFFVLVAVCGLLSYRDRHWSGFIIFGIAAGLGLLLKGPVIFAYVLPLALTIPWWHEHYRPEHKLFLVKGIAAGLMISLVLFGAWIIPVVETLGLDQVRTLFLQQTADRMLQATSHARPFWWYFPFLPLLLFPWACKISFWKSLGTQIADSNRNQWRFLLIWMVPAFLFLTAIKAKQLHYLLPLLPPLVIGCAALLTNRNRPVTDDDNYVAGLLYLLAGTAFLIYRSFIAHPYNQWVDELYPLFPVAAVAAGLLLITIKSKDPIRSIRIMALGTFIFLFSSYAALLTAPRPFTGIDGFSQALASLQKKNVPLGHLGTHTEQFTFPGQLTRPLEKITPDQLGMWAKNHPDGYIIMEIKESDLDRMHPVYLQPYRFRQDLVLISCRDILQGKYAF